MGVIMYTIIDNFLPISIQNMIEYHYQYKPRWNYSSFTSGDYGSECDEKHYKQNNQHLRKHLLSLQTCYM